MPEVTLLQGDVIEMLKTLPDASVDCVITSPPYWSLRDYGTALWQGGSSECDHKERFARNDGNRQGIDGFGGNANLEGHADMGVKQFRNICGKCGAIRIDSQIGLEATPEAYVAKLVAVFAEVWRVMKPTATLWLNLGDSYAGSGKGLGSDHGKAVVDDDGYGGKVAVPNGLKPKDLVGIPWRVAFALQGAGWWLRDAIIWAKAEVDHGCNLEGSTMPGSQGDRPTSGYEFIFLLARHRQPYYDQEACKTKSGAILRNVWRMNTAGFPGYHYATFPEELPRRCILLGTSERGVCSACGKPWVRVTEKPEGYPRGSYHDHTLDGVAYGMRQGGKGPVNLPPGMQPVTTGWCPSCTCGAPTRPATVLDPFCGSGTTGVVACQQGRDFIGIDLNPDYLEMARKRIEPYRIQERLF